MVDILPIHIGFIIDGNRRWAVQRGLAPYEGHNAGYEAIKRVLLEVLRRGVPYASAYVFSTENWKRSPVEVAKLMELLLRVLHDDVPEFIEKNVRLRVIGSRQKLSKKICAAIDDAERRTAHLTGGQLIMCLNYGGHQEIADAVKRIVANGTDAAHITPKLIGQHLYAADVPPCDIIVRTSGERRLSNFMLWRSSYSELLFLDKLWPDMTKSDVAAILKEYTRRSRRFGG